MNKTVSGAEVSINTDITILDKIDFRAVNQGNINITAGSAIDLASGAFIEDESNSGYIHGEGVIQTTMALNAPVAQAPGNLGVEISSAANLSDIVFMPFETFLFLAASIIQVIANLRALLGSTSLGIW